MYALKRIAFTAAARYHPQMMYNSRKLLNAVDFSHAFMRQNEIVAYRNRGCVRYSPFRFLQRITDLSSTLIFINNSQYISRRTQLDLDVSRTDFNILFRQSSLIITRYIYRLFGVRVGSTVLENSDDRIDAERVNAL